MIFFGGKRLTFSKLLIFQKDFEFQVFPFFTVLHANILYKILFTKG